MYIIKTKIELKKLISQKRSEGLAIGFVPTMGALHDGHLSLCKLALQQADKVLASIYVNPTQFGKNEDLDNYPKQIEQDLEKLKDYAVDAVFLPKNQQIYPQYFDNYIKAKPNLKGILCDVDRPTHFDGVVTVVNRLFDLVKPDVAVFGEKDFQQLAIIKNMAKNLHPDIKIIGGEIIREVDGLAMSSRNQYLNKKQRLIAGKLNKRLNELLLILGGNKGHILPHLESCKKSLLRDGFDEVQYLEVRTAENLEIVQNLPMNKSSRIFCAVKIGTIRLIDNISI